MRNLAPALLAIILTVMLGANAVQSQGSPLVMQPGSALAVQCASGLSGTIGATAANLVCATLVPSATATTTATATATPSDHPAGWHPPTDHEHGASPPAWVLASANQPFSQTREGHTSYKGMRATQTNRPQVESYIVTHIVSTTFARSHGDHDYQLWVRDSTGAVSYWAGMLDFAQSASNPTSPIPERTSDTGERPIALSVGDAGCETWYTRPGRLAFDLGWTICGRYQTFAGVTLNGLGLHRSADWILYPDRFASRPGAAPTLAAEARVEFGVSRISFVRTGHANPGPNVVPIN